MRQTSESAANWVEPPVEQQSLTRFLETIRDRIWIVVAAVVIVTAAAILYVATAEKVYEATVKIQVVPIDDPEGRLSSLGLISQSSDPLRAVETASTLLTSQGAAERVAAEDGQGRDSQAILSKVKAEPIAESDIVSLTAQAPTATGAASLANAFAKAALQEQAKTLRETIDRELPALNARLRELPEGIGRDTIAAQIAQFEALRVAGDPTLRIIEPAVPPGSPVSPKPFLSIFAGLIAGFVLGIGAVFALRMLDPLIRREDQVRSRYRLPILARVPQERGGPKDRPLVWSNLVGGSVEAYRTLRAVLAGSASRRSPAILISSPGPGEGKTTSAISLAASLALTDKRVILIEADLRRPAIGRAFNLSVSTGIVSVLAGEASLEECLVTAPIGEGHLGLLLAEESGGAGAELLALPTALELLEQAKELADVVVVDSPPLATVVDALPMARAVDEVVIALKLGTSRIDRTQELAELLAESGITPAGFVLIGVPGHSNLYYGDPDREQVVEMHPTRPAASAG
jgi:Mrp family chromosome partitioning ATPase/capsular polysaccharide biosynthesis protein